jgi:hypothetical protein
MFGLSLQKIVIKWQQMCSIRKAFKRYINILLALIKDPSMHPDLSLFPTARAGI